jgi:hypothetical protein
MQQRDNTDIKQCLIKEMESKGIPTDRLVVQFHDDVIILKGKVESLAQKEEAGKLAHQVPGILKVTNELEVVPHKGNLARALSEGATEISRWASLNLEKKKNRHNNSKSE